MKEAALVWCRTVAGYGCRLWYKADGLDFNAWTFSSRVSRPNIKNLPRGLLPNSRGRFLLMK